MYVCIYVCEGRNLCSLRLTLRSYFCMNIGWHIRVIGLCCVALVGGGMRPHLCLRVLKLHTDVFILCAFFVFVDAVVAVVVVVTILPNIFVSAYTGIVVPYTVVRCGIASYSVAQRILHEMDADRYFVARHTRIFMLTSEDGI